MFTRFALLALVATLSLPAAPVAAQNSSYVETVIRDRAAYWGVSGNYLVNVAWCESRLDPGALGRAGEIGVYQLHPYGLLPLFYERGYDNPWSAWQNVDFAVWAFSRGLGSHWSCR